jgi:hypothetical protein
MTSTSQINGMKNVLSKYPDFFFYTLITVLLGMAAHFIKQLHRACKRVDKNISKVKATTNILETEFKGIYGYKNIQSGPPYQPVHIAILYFFQLICKRKGCNLYFRYIPFT